MRHRQRPLFIRFLILFAVAFIAANAAAHVACAASSGLDSETSSVIAAEFPDRMTSSFDSQRLTSYLRANLEANGWRAEILPYSVLMRSGGKNAKDVSFTHVSGENVLAFAVAQPTVAPVDLLILAPYDTLRGETGHPEETSYTARATAALLSFAAGVSPAETGRSMNLAVAFVSGHYQFGAGTSALLNELVSVRGLSVKAAVVLGDIDALDALPLTIDEETPAGLVQAVHQAAMKNHVPVTVVGPRTRESWYRAVMTPRSGAFSIESMVDAGVFAGEAAMLAENGIPAVTFGAPRNNLDLPLTQASAGKGLDVAVVLLELSSSYDPSEMTAGPLVSDRVVVQALGSLYMIPRVAFLVAGVTAGLVVVLLLALRAKRIGGLSSLATLGGVLLAMVVAHPLRSLWFRGDPQKYHLAYKPNAVLLLYVWSGLTVVALGVFRIWRIRARISYLHSRIPSPAAAAHSGGSRLETAPGDATPPTAGNWAGPWGLAALTAVLIGTALAGSELAAPALAATLSLLAAALLDRPKRYGRAATLLIRMLGTLPILSLLMWAGSPLATDPARIYSLSVTGFRTEGIAFSVAFAVFVACLVSSFRLPAPSPRKKMVLANLAEVAILAALVAAGLLIPRAGSGAIPARAVVREYLGNEGRITLDTTRPLGRLALVPEGSASPVPGVPLWVENRTLSETYRLGTGKVPSTWTDIRHIAGEIVKDPTESNITATVTATFAERPAYFQLVLQDVALGRGTTTPFRLLNLSDVTGVQGAEGEVPPGLQVEPRPGYSITVTWWMPTDSSLTRELCLTVAPSSSRADVLGRAVYIDRSYTGLSPSAPGTRFTLVTTVSGLAGYR